MTNLSDDNELVVILKHNAKEIAKLRAQKKVLEEKLTIAEKIITIYKERDKRDKSTTQKLPSKPTNQSKSPFVPMPKKTPDELFVQKIKELERVPIDRHIKTYKEKMAQFKINDDNDVAILDPNLPAYMSMLMKQNR